MYAIRINTHYVICILTFVEVLQKIKVVGTKVVCGKKWKWGDMGKAVGTITSGLNQAGDVVIKWSSGEHYNYGMGDSAADYLELAGT